MKSLTDGKPLKLILLFSIPLFIGNLFQLLYSIVDIHIVGVTLGQESLAAVGGTSTISDLMIALIFGLTNGFAIISARCFGADNVNGLRKTVAMTFLLGGGIAVFLAVISLIFLIPILEFLNVPVEIMREAAGYIRIIIVGMIAGALYNACAATLRAVGDTVTPLIFLIVSSFLNVFFDYFFVLGFGMGVEGVAYATALSQLISFILCIIYMYKKYPMLRLEGKDFKPDYALMSTMLKTGMSVGLMNALVQIGTMSLQTTINTFGTETIVAHTAARKITSIYMMWFPVFGQALATFCGQNLGAGKYERIRQGILQTFMVNLLWDIIVIASAYTMAPTLIKLITGFTNENIINTASLYLKINTVFYFETTVVCLFRNSFQGIGDTVTPIISSMLELVVKVVIAIVLAPAIGYMGIIVSEPIAWFLMAIPLVIQFFKNPIINNSHLVTNN